MPKLQTLGLFVLSLSPLIAETVLWKANGTLDSGTGIFLRQDLSPDDPVTIRITYDDGATPNITTNSFGRLDTDYWENIDLLITISTGSYTWEGSVTTAISGSPYTLFTRVKDPFPTVESLDIKISTEDLGTFPSFPFRLGESSSSFFLEFQGSNSSFLEAGISPENIHPEVLASASGTISTGVGNDLSFTIDPASLEVIFEADEIIPPVAPPLSFSTSSDAVSLSWPSDFRFRYRVESTADLSSDLWTEIETRFGTDATITRSYPRLDSTHFYRVVALPRTPAE